MTDNDMPISNKHSI